MSAREVIAAVSLAVCLPMLAREKLTPSGVNGLLAVHGGPETVRLLTEDDDTWDVLLGGVATGRREWLLVAKRLSEFTDAHSSETLGMAVEEALPNAPDLTLELFGAEACAGVGFADQGAKSLADVLRELEKRRRALSTVTRPTLAAAKQQCLLLLQETETAAPNWNYPTKE